MMYIVQRNWSNLKRHKLTLYVSMPIFALVMALIGSIYSNNIVTLFENVPTFKSLLANVPKSDLQNATMLVWFLIFFQIFALIFPAVGLFLGVRMLPFNETDGKELIFSTKISIFKYFTENFVLALILVPISALPMVLVTVLYLGLNIDATISIVIATVILSFFVMTVAMVTVFGASTKSSSRIGLGYGAVYYFIFFILNLLASEIQTSTFSIFGFSLKDLNNFSLMFKMNIITNGYERTWNENYLLVCSIIILILFVLTLVFLFRTDYIQTRGGSYTDTTDINETINGFRSKFSFIRTPVDSVLNKVGWRYPIFRDQLQSSSGFFIVYAFVTSLLVFVVMIAYPGNASMEALFLDLNSLIGNPLIAGFLFGNTPTAAANANLQGFLMFKLLTLHWLYYGPFLFIATYYILIRDKSNKYDEITWSLPHTRSSVIVSRTFAMILYFWITIALNWITIWIGYAALITFMPDAAVPSISITLVAFFFLALGYSLFLFLFLGIAVIVKSRYVTLTLAFIFVISIFAPMVAYVLNDSWIEYLSPYKYFDVVGIMMEKVNIVQIVIPKILIGGIISTILYIVGIKVYTPKKDIV